MITTNWQARDLIDASELTEEEREEFDYLDWDKIERGEDSASFFRYKGTLYDLGEFQRVPTVSDGLYQGWDGYQSDTYFSGLLIKLTDDGEGVIVGRYCE
jgi:hypothetical protein